MTIKESGGITAPPLAKLPSKAERAAVNEKNPAKSLGAADIPIVNGGSGDNDLGFAVAKSDSSKLDVEA